MRRQRHLSPGSRPGFPEIVSAPLLVVSPTAERNAGLFTKALPVGSRKCCRPRESTAEGNLGNPGVTAASDEHSFGCIKPAIQNPLSRGVGEVPLKPQLDCPRLQATFAFKITHGDLAGEVAIDVVTKSLDHSTVGPCRVLQHCFKGRDRLDQRH